VNDSKKKDPREWDRWRKARAVQRPWFRNLRPWGVRTGLLSSGPIPTLDDLRAWGKKIGLVPPRACLICHAPFSPTNPHATLNRAICVDCMRGRAPVPRFEITPPHISPPQMSVTFRNYSDRPAPASHVFAFNRYGEHLTAAEALGLVPLFRPGPLMPRPDVALCAHAPGVTCPHCAPKGDR